MPLQPYLKRIIEGRETLSRADSAELLQTILRGESSELEIAALLGAFATRGPTPAEIAGFVDTMRIAATPIPLTSAEQAAFVDTCGTGADSSGTFNISTAAALVAAAAGATVAKHGNRAVTSACGSADVLEALGIPVGLSPDEGAAALREHRFAFLHAPSLHPAMKTVMPVRRALGIRTIFSSGRSALQSCRGLGAGHGRLCPASRPPGSRNHGSARHPARLRRPRQIQAARRHSQV